MSARSAKAGRARFDIATIVRAHRSHLEAEHRLTCAQKRVLTDIARCRTAALGGHLDHCPSCGYEHPRYNSCRNRHCPKCQALAAEAWIDKRSAYMLDVGHFHVVFTVPSELRPLAKHAPRVVYNALFHAASQTLLELGESRFHATLGATLVLHTWTRDLRFHPHVHAIVTAGGLSHDGERFRRSSLHSLFRVEIMGKLLRGKVLAALSLAYAEGAFADFDTFRDPAAFPRLIRKVAKLPWNVDARKPFKKSKHVLKYLGRYTHRVGIANSRLLAVTDDRVVFKTKKRATETLTPVALLWRFVQHVLPKGFHKLRHIGLYAAGAHERLALARARLEMPTPAPRPKLSWEEKLLALTGREVRRCPACGGPLLRSALPVGGAPVVGSGLPPPARGPP